MHTAQQSVQDQFSYICLLSYQYKLYYIIYTLFDSTAIEIIIKIIRVELGLGRPSALVEFGASLTIIIPGTHPIFAPTPKKEPILIKMAVNIYFAVTQI